MITLDGSTLEGGGQLVRVALALSAITLTPIRITNIRANRGPSSHNSNKRSNPRKVEGGLKESHLAALLWLSEQCDAKTTGAEIGSRDVTFKPRRPRPHPSKAVKTADAMEKTSRYTIELRNPGSVWLIFQAIFPYIAFSMGREDLRSIELVLKGGTNVSKSMSGEYVTQVLLPVLQKVGVKVDVDVVVSRRGWAGSAQEVGEVSVRIDRNSKAGKGERGGLEGFQVVDRGDIDKIGVSIIARPAETRRRVIEKLRHAIKTKFDIPVEVAADEDSGDDRRFYILLVAHTTNGWRLGRDFLGSGANLKTLAQLNQLIDGSVRRVVDELHKEIKRGGCVDEYLQDQLVIFQALARGMSRVDTGQGQGDGTLHTRTVRWVCEEILAEKAVRFHEDGKCEGCGWDDGESPTGLEDSLKKLEI